MKTQKYRKSPIIEVVCEFRFDLDNANDATLPGIFYASIQDKFPVKKHRNLGTLVPLDGGIESEMIVTQLAQFYNDDETLLVQIGNNMLTINCLKRYPYWENFKPEIMSCFTKYLSVAKPKGIKKIALRSINKIYLPKENLDLENYFKFYPTKPDNISTPLSSYNLTIESRKNEGRDVLIMKNFTTISDDVNKSAVFLDLEYIMNKSNGVELDHVEKWIELAHLELYKSFDSSISDNLKAEFEPVK